MEEEYRKAIDALKAAAPSETRRAELDAEYEMARSFAWDFAGDSSATAANVHWGNFCDRTIRGQTMEVYLRNWLEAAGQPDGWETVRRARGTLYGVDFAATSGVAVISVSDRTLLLRLSPMRLHEKGGEVFAAYDLIAPEVLEASSYMVEQGRVRIGRSD